jgi:membrane fusion protein, heavy metal efflux system
MRRTALALTLALVLSSCNGRPASTSGGAAAPPASTAAAYFTVPAEQLAHLQIATVHKASWTTTLHTTGTVDWDNDHTTQAITQVSGPITRILVDAGTHVKAGDPLLFVASADITSAISAYRKAKNRLDLAQRVLDRTRDLLVHKALAQRDLEAAEADYNDASTDLQTSLQALKILGVTQEGIAEAERQNVGIRPELAMRAPLTGTVVQKLVLPGQFIQAGATAAFVISNTTTVWVQGHLYEKDLTTIHLGDKVEVRNSSFPVAFQGVIAYVGDLIDPATRTTPVRIVTANQGGLLKKDLFVDVTIADRTTRNVLVVPSAAVLYDEQNFPFVYLEAGPGQFAQRLVTLGTQQDSETEVREGLKGGDRVVSQGSVFLQFANTYRQ